MKTNIDYIIFAVEQAKAAVAFGISRNHSRRNLTICLMQYWQNKELKLHQTGQKKRIQCSKAALKIPFKQCRVEHSVPLSAITNRLMEMENPTPVLVKEVLEQWFSVVLVTPEEDILLRQRGLRFKMPDDWDQRDVFAHYKAIGIELPDQPTTHPSPD